LIAAIRGNPDLDDAVTGFGEPTAEYRLRLGIGGPNDLRRREQQHKQRNLRRQRPSEGRRQAISSGLAIATRPSRSSLARRRARMQACSNTSQVLSALGLRLAAATLTVTNFWRVERG
jgi:hypothetical protein